MIRIKVPLGTRSYEVLVGDGALDELASLLPAGARRAAVVTQHGIPVSVDLAIPSKVFVVPPGERAKSLSTVEELCRGFARDGLTRADVVVGVGGGVVTDLAGFAASTYHRGVPVVHVATTLLAEVDAAIGGKTGVNLPEGKNLVGTFWQPAGVCCDTATLATLPAREWASGLGEMVKYRFLGIDDLLGLELEQQVARCVELKADVVAADEREAGRRAILNYGHTLAHALEAAALAAEGRRDGLRHGEAVAIGLVFAARLAERLGRIGAARVGEHEASVASCGLPSRLPAGSQPLALIELMRRDKKAVEELTFVLDGADGVEVVEGVEADDVAAVLESMR